MKLELVHTDTCLPDSWSGHHAAHISIPVWPGMTLRNIKESLKNELRQGAIAGNDTCAMFLASDFVLPEHVKLADQYVRAAYAAINRLKPVKKGQRRFFTDLEEQGEDYDYSVYAYFVFVEI